MAHLFVQRIKHEVCRTCIRTCYYAEFAKKRNFIPYQMRPESAGGNRRRPGKHNMLCDASGSRRLYQSKNFSYAQTELDGDDDSLRRAVASRNLLHNTNEQRLFIMTLDSIESSAMSVNTAVSADVQAYKSARRLNEALEKHGASWPRSHSSRWAWPI